mgnify:CR=1 FL=1
MANLGIKVETVISKFYDVRQDDNIKGLYEVRKKGDSDGEIIWYFFSSNNATYHSSGNDCVIRDINQSNSGYLERLKEAFEKAKRKNKKIFWLVLVFGDGIGLAPDGYDWLASIELRVNLDDITASLSMRKYPVGKGRSGYIEPCCIRVEQDKYFNTTFISCKNKDGDFTSEYMRDYFEIYDNRPYHDIVWNTCIDNAEVIDKVYTLQQLGDILDQMYSNAEDKMKVASIHIFGIKYGKNIIEKEFRAPDIIKAAGLNESYSTELQKALNIYRCFSKNSYGISISDGEEPKEEMKSSAARKTGAENILLYGVPGSGKSHEIKTKYCDDEKRMERVVFHPDYTYSDFVGQILPRVEKDESGNDKLKYVFTPGPFTKMLKKAENDSDNYYYLVIEELNRGNAPAIFGEIFQLLDRKDEDEFPAEEVGESEYGISNYEVAKEVYDDEKHPVRIPSNMYILATMNTADQNVFTLDTAFQRRWNMRQIENNFEKSYHSKDIIAGTKVSWGAFATVINDMVIDINVDMASSEDKRLGTYFAKKKELEVSRFPQKVLKYLWDDAFKMDKTAIFNENCKSLEDVVVTYETATTDKLAAVLRLSVYEKMISKMQQKDTENDEN